MHPRKSQSPPQLMDLPSSEQLDSWKEIASYLKRDERTVRRWQKEGLPVYRHMHAKRAAVYAYKSEIDAWWRNGHSRLDSAEAAATTPRWRLARFVTAGLVLVIGVFVTFGVVRERLLRRPASGEVNSLAVLPLKNLSDNREQDYFADGMTESLITELGKISTLKVISHQSVLQYKKDAKPLPQIAQELKVDALLEGTVLRSGDRVRVTANLVQATPERHIWAESYEVDQRDILAVQRDVARAVASQVRAKLTPQEQARLATSRRVDPEAYEAYLLGRAYLTQPPTSTNWTRAEQYLEKAIAKDPGYAPAYASLAELYTRARGSPIKNPRDLRLQAPKWAEKALKLDDSLAEAHNALARAAQQEWDWTTAEREYRRAIELNPSYPLAHSWYAMYLYAMQRLEEAVAEAKRAQQLDPASARVNTWAAAIYLFAGRSEEGMAALQKALELDPRYLDASIVLARTYVANGMYQRTIAELRRALTLNQEREPLLLGALAHAYARGGQRAEALKLLRELKRTEIEAKEYVPPFGIIWAYAGLRDNDQAFAWLERAYEMGADRMVWLNVDSFLDPLRSDPRFNDLVRRVGLPQKTSLVSGQVK
jgi:TolB-like protein/Flp pilus assembly protein TadD